MSHPLFVAVRARRALARPVVRRIAVAAVALATGLVVTSLVQSAEAARARWGAGRPVVVATRDLTAGEIVGAGSVAVRTLPEAAVPDRALSGAPLGRVVRHPVARGEALLPDRLAPDGLTGVAALVPAGRLAVAVPVGPGGAPPLAVGDVVDVLAVVPGGAVGGAVGGAAPAGGPGTGGDVPAFPLVADAAVVDVGEGAVTVAVPRDDAAAVAAVLAQGAVVLALVGG